MLGPLTRDQPFMERSALRFSASVCGQVFPLFPITAMMAIFPACPGSLGCSVDSGDLVLASG